VSFQDLKPNPQDTSAFYLKMIYQLLANPNASEAYIISTLTATPAFSPPRYAIWTNSLWFLSVASSILSAMLAMLLRQWARRYLMVTQQPCRTPAQRARVRENFTNHLHGSHLWVTGFMAFFLYLSIVLYMIGGLIYLFHLNRAVFSSAALCTVYGAVFYFIITAHSIYKPEVLWYTPYSPLFLKICLGVWDIVLRVSSYVSPLHRLCDYSRRRHHDLSLRYQKGLLRGKYMAVEEAASKRSSEIDLNVLEWTFNYAVDDPGLEQFLDAIPGFFDSKLVNNLQGRLSYNFRIKFGQALNGFLDHTFSSNTFTESVRGDRLLICLKAARVALGRDAVSKILGKIFDGRWPAALRSIEVGHVLKHWDDIGFSSEVRRIVARIVSHIQVRERDDHWIALVQDEFGVPGCTLREHVASGDGASLAILIHITRQLLHTDFPPWGPDILRVFSNFDVHKTLSVQQHDFCTAWNEVVREARNHGAGSTPVFILKEIRHVFAALHRDTSDSTPALYSATIDDDVLLDSLSYPFCCVVDHRLDSIADLHVNKGPANDPSHPLAPHEVPDVAPPLTLILTQSQPVPTESQSAVAVEVSAEAAISRTANTIHSPTFDSDPTQRKDQVTEPTVLSSTRFDSPPTPTPTPTSMPSLSSRAIHSKSLAAAAMDTIPTPSDYVDPTPGTTSSSSDAAWRPSIPPHVSIFLDQSTTLGVEGAGTPNDTQDPNPPIPMGVYRRPRNAAPSDPNISVNTLRRDSDVQHGTSN
jgi:hypothetical protein